MTFDKHIFSNLLRPLLLASALLAAVPAGHRRRKLP